MKNILNTTLFGAALLVAAAGFAQSSTSPQKGDEDRTPNSPASSSTTSSTDTNSTSGTDSKTSGSTSGSAYGSTTGSTTGTTGTTGSSGAAGSTGATGSYGTTGSTYGSSTMAPRSYAGTVKTINAGRTLVITMANGRTQTFDISNSPALDSSVAVGSRVRVKQTVDASGHKVVTFEPYR